MALSKRLERRSVKTLENVCVVEPAWTLMGASWMRDSSPVMTG